MSSSSTQVAETVPFDNDSTVLISTDVQGVILELLSAITGGTFSYKIIQTLQSVVIPASREMLVNNYIDIDGVLTIEGDLSIV